MTEISEVLKKTLDYMVSLQKLIGSMPTPKGYTHEKVEVKRSAYANVVDGLK